MTKILIAFGVVILGAVAWYLISPFFRVVETDEASPLDRAALSQPPQSAPLAVGNVQDAMDTMDEKTRIAFERAVDAAAKNIKEMQDPVPSGSVSAGQTPTGPILAAQGLFMPRAHDVKGKALLIEQGEKKILRFEDFETINGPDLYIFLSSELGIGDAVTLGRIRATRGSANYEVPDGTNTSRYNKVLVWCRPFGVLFSYAELK